MAMLNIVGLQLTNLTAYNEYITDVIIAVIVYLSAFSLAIRMLIAGKKKAVPPKNGYPKPGDPKPEDLKPIGKKPDAAEAVKGGDEA